MVATKADPEHFPEVPNGVSVVIPTLDRADVLLDTVGDLTRQDFSEYELIIVDQSEAPAEAVVGFLRTQAVTARYFKADFKGLPAARNFGWRHARYDVVLYVDDDIRTDESLVRAHYEAHVRTGAALVAGGVYDAKDGPDQGGSGFVQLVDRARPGQLPG
ncbi:MAG TPA: glycosyltransferase family A protein [Gammaproteobacteria bacterium]|nr:glycosyltransferase family A protein [Gammaproteobacteria bacterium]